MTDVSNVYAAIKFYDPVSTRASSRSLAFTLMFRIVALVSRLVNWALYRNNRGFWALSHLLTDVYTRPRSGHALLVERERLEAIAESVRSPGGWTGTSVGR